MTLNIKIPITKSKAKEIKYKYDRIKNRILNSIVIILVFAVSLSFVTLISGMIGILIMLFISGGVPTTNFYDSFMSPIPMACAIIADIILLNILIKEFNLISLQYKDDVQKDKNVNLKSFDDGGDIKL